MRRPACPLCPDGELMRSSAAERSPLARTLGIVLMAISTPFLFYALKVIENIPAAEGDVVVRGVWMPLGSAVLLAIAAVPLGGAWALRRHSGRARRCSACATVFDPGAGGRFVPRH